MVLWAQSEKKHFNEASNFGTVARGLAGMGGAFFCTLQPIFTKRCALHAILQAAFSFSSRNATVYVREGIGTAIAKKKHT
jgi:hypothetical protein